MAELMRTNDPVLITVVEDLLGGDDIPYHVADRNISVIEGSIEVVQARILVPDDRVEEARRLLEEAELGDWLRRRSTR